MKKAIKFYLVNLFMFFIFLCPVLAEENSYEVSILGENEIMSYHFDTYDHAEAFYLEHFDDGNNIFIQKDEKIIQARYALIRFSSNASCTINTDFIVDATDESGYLNGCYGTDGAFLGLNSKQTYAKFMISGVIGWVKLDDVEIVLVEDVEAVSSYRIKNNELHHQIKDSFDNSRFSTVLVLDQALKYLSEDRIYYSYDGHYFYEDIRIMLDDYRKESRQNAINSQEPYYNYYMYVSNRTMSQYTTDEIKTYLEDYRKIDQTIVQFNDNTLNAIHDTLNQSMMYGIEKDLLFYQNLYGANGLMMLSLSMNESAVGRSNLAFARCNLFGHAAYDSDVEKYASKYSSVSSSIASHAKNYISSNYSNPNKFMYHGSYFGNKESGMNVSYASDPYWGEKAAAYYKKIDDALGNKDINSVALGIRKSAVSTPIFSEPSLESEVLSVTSKNGNFSFVLLDKLVGMDELEYYKIQMDESREENGVYQRDENAGYILCSAVDTVLNEEKIGSLRTIHIRANANGGSFYGDMEIVEFDCLDQEHIAISEPIRDGYEFESWNILQEGDVFEYVAQYKKIASIELIELPKTEYFVGNRIDLKGGVIQIQYEDSSFKNITLLSSMVSGYDLNEPGTQNVIVNYCNLICSYEIHISEKKEWDSENLLERIRQVDENTELSELESIKELMLQHPDYFTFDQRRIIDRKLQEFYPKLNIRISEDPLNMQISNLALNVDLSKCRKKFFKVLLNIKVDEVTEEFDHRMREVAEANGYLATHSFFVEGTYQSDPITITIPLTLTVEKQDENKTHQYVVLHETEGNVEIVYSKQADHSITLEIEEWGNYLLAYRETVNEISGEDAVENNHYVVLDHHWEIYLLAAVLVMMIMVLLLVKKKQKRKTLKRQRMLNKDRKG